jgi:hypothetical protein
MTIKRNKYLFWGNVENGFESNGCCVISPTQVQMTREMESWKYCDVYGGTHH